jgi:hypothetical protein
MNAPQQSYSLSCSRVQHPVVKQQLAVSFEWPKVHADLLPTSYSPHRLQGNCSATAEKAPPNFLEAAAPATTVADLQEAGSSEE